MTDQHPITPPPALVNELQDLGNLDAIALAYRAGADQELKACLRLVEIEVCDGAYELSRYIRAARRPKPPSLKEQALEALQEAAYMADDSPPQGICSDQIDIIRRALEQLDD